MIQGLEELAGILLSGAQVASLFATWAPGTFFLTLT